MMHQCTMLGWTHVGLCALQLRMWSLELELLPPPRIGTVTGDAASPARCSAVEQHRYGRRTAGLMLQPEAPPSATLRAAASAELPLCTQHVWVSTDAWHADVLELRGSAVHGGGPGGGGGRSREQSRVWPTYSTVLRSAAGALQVDQDGAGNIFVTRCGQARIGPHMSGDSRDGSTANPGAVPRREESEADRHACLSSKSDCFSPVIVAGDELSVIPRIDCHPADPKAC